jgi:hypothetical protein
MAFFSSRTVGRTSYSFHRARAQAAPLLFLALLWMVIFVEFSLLFRLLASFRQNPHHSPTTPLRHAPTTASALSSNMGLKPLILGLMVIVAAVLFTGVHQVWVLRSCVRSLGLALLPSLPLTLAHSATLLPSLAFSCTLSCFPRRSAKDTSECIGEVAHCFLASRSLVTI